MRTGRLVISGERDDQSASSKVLNVLRKMRGEDEKGSPVIEQTPKKYNIQDGANEQVVMPPPPPPEVLDPDDKASAFR